MAIFCKFVIVKAEEPIVSYGQLNPEGVYTYWDYLKWKFEERVELIKGKIFKMSPGPNTLHQRVSFKISWALGSYFNDSPCSIFTAPYDVRLPIPSAQKDTTVVQPDLIVVCDASKIDEKGCNGAPDLVIEILSPGSSKHDMHTKFYLYEESGVKEYWIIHPLDKIGLIYTLKEGKYIGLPPATEGDQLKSPLFPYLQIDVDSIFA